MTFRNKFEKYLKAAPKPSAPDGLLNRLKADVSLQEMKTHQSSLRKWFVPTGRSVSSWRVAAAVAMTIAVLLPLSYGATKLIKRFITISQLPTITVDFPGSGKLSPDGKHFAGVTWDDELIVIDTATGKHRKIATDCFGKVVWSADGSEIAVRNWDKDEDKSRIAAIAPATGEMRTLSPRRGDFEDWSRDGKLILFVRSPANSSAHAVVTANLENGERTVMAEDTGVWPYPSFSPNGDRVSYVTEEGGRSILHLQEIEGTSHVRYSDFPGDIGRPIWSPDGSHIVFTGTQRGVSRQYMDLWALRVQGNQFVGAPFPVVPDVEQMQFFNWSQNGQLAYRTGFELGGIFTLPVDLKTGKATGSPRQLVRSGLGSHCWSPDGKQIATPQGSELSFISTNSGENIRNLPLSEIEYIGRGMSWSPDGKMIAFCGRDKTKKTGIFLIEINTGELKLLVPLEGGVPNWDPTWAPDSKTIAYGYKNGIYVVKAENEESKQIISPLEKLKAEMVHRPVFAPDGSSVAYIAQDREDHERIMVTTIDGQETRQFLLLKDKDLSINIFDLSPDGRYIVFTPGNKEIWCAPTDGGEAFKIGDISNVGDNAWAWLPKWSPKGDAITFTVTCEKYQYWVMENFLPTE